MINPIAERPANLVNEGLLAGQRDYFPKEAPGIIGVSNRVAWTNTDAIGHAVTNKDGYVDKISG